MVCHRTFKDQSNNWVYPNQAVEIEQGKFIHEETKEELTVGRSEKMSKSKKNVIEPSNIIRAYGADTARLFMLSDSPVSRDLEWVESGVDGSWRYVNRLYRLVLNFTNNKNFSDISKINSNHSKYQYNHENCHYQKINYPQYFYSNLNY